MKEGEVVKIVERKVRERKQKAPVVGTLERRPSKKERGRVYRGGEGGKI